MPKETPNKRHTEEFKQQAAEYMKKHKLPCVETAKLFDADYKNVAL
jgi:transposase-like protein